MENNGKRHEKLSKKLLPYCREPGTKRPRSSSRPPNAESRTKPTRWDTNYCYKFADGTCTKTESECDRPHLTEAQAKAKAAGKVAPPPKAKPKQNLGRLHLPAARSDEEAAAKIAAIISESNRKAPPEDSFPPRLLAWDEQTGRHSRVIERTTPGTPGYISPQELRERDAVRKERGEPLDSPRVGPSICEPCPWEHTGVARVEEVEEE